MGRRKAALNRHVGDDLERPSGGIGALVDVEVELPALALGKFEEDRRAHRADRGTMRSGGAEDARSVSVEHRFDVGHMRAFAQMVDA